MKSKALLVSFIALFAIVLSISAVAAQDFVTNTDVTVEVNGISVNAAIPSASIAVSASETVPIEVFFKADDLDTDTLFGDIKDVRVKVYIEGFKNEISDETSRFHVIEGNSYVKRFSLTMPSTEDLESLTENLTLLVRFSAKGYDSIDMPIALEAQKTQHSLNIHSVSMPEVVTSGSNVAVDVVVENNGNERLDNVYVIASIPALGISSKVYAGDLEASFDSNDDSIDDATSKRVYLSIPRTAVSGNYEVEIEAYNYDASSKKVERIVVEDVATGVIPSSTSRTIAPGQETSFDLVLVNPSDSIVVYTISPAESKGILIDVEDSVVAVGAGSSRTVKIKAKATSNTEEGTYVLTINADSETGLSKQVSFNVNVEKSSSSSNSMADSTVILTVVLVVVFVVLLIVLIALLSKRPTEEDIGETNYY